MKLDAIRIVTRCTTREQFIDVFGRYCNPTACFVPTGDMRPIGLSASFTIALADGTPLLRGEGVVLDAWRTAANPWGRPGVHLGIARLADDCAALFDALLAERSGATRRSVASQLQLLLEAKQPEARLETPTLQMPPLVPATTPVPMLDAIIVSTTEGVSVDAVPAEIAAEATEPTPPDLPKATLLGFVPLVRPPAPAASPRRIRTERVRRIVLATPGGTRVLRRPQRVRALLQRWWDAIARRFRGERARVAA